MKTLRRKRLVLPTIAATVCVILSACGGGDDGAEVDTARVNAMSVQELAENAAGEKVTWLTTMYPTDTAQKLADAFTKKYPDIEVSVDRKTTNENWEQLRTSKSAGSSETDVFSVTQPAFFNMANEAGYVDCYLPETAKQLGKNYKDPNGCWFSARQSIFALAYNTDQVTAAEAPKSYKGLSDPKWKGRVGLLDPELSNNAFSAYFTYSRLAGGDDLNATEDFWASVGDNDPELYKQGGALINAVASGQVSIAWVFGYRAWQFSDDGAPVEVSIPKEGVVTNKDFTMLISDSDAPHAARLFMHFLASKESMNIGTKDAYYYSVRPDVPVYPENRPALADLKLLPPDFEDQDEDHDEFLEMWTDNVKG